MSSKRLQLRQQRQNQNRRTALAWGLGILIVVASLGYFMWRSASTPATPTPTHAPFLTPDGNATNLLGQAQAIDSDRSHIEDEQSDPGPYSTNPPTSGHHYPTPLSAGFYDTNTYKYPQAHLVHSLEHGYIIFWYNCKTAVKILDKGW